MSHELIYTSVARGLRPGEYGFCTVAHTQGIPAALAAKLESLSGYRHLFPPSDRRAELNPVLHSHLRLQIDGLIHQVLSRIADAGLDYSQRTNKFAHHIALDRSELPVAGPAWVLFQPHVMEREWNDRDPQILSSGRRIPAGDSPPRPCRHWEEVMGDAGWAGALASMTSLRRPAYLVYQPGMDPLPLIAEALALLPPSQRWDVTFSTYFLGLPADVPCQWRCVVADSREAVAALESNNSNVIVLDENQGQAPDGPLVEAARTGRVQQEPVAANRPARVAPPPPIAAPAFPSAATPVRRQIAGSSGPILTVADEESAPTELAELSHPTSRSGSVLTLVLGLILGSVLMFLFVLAVELFSERSLPGIAGIASKEKKEWDAEKIDLTNKLKKEEDESKKLATALENKEKEPTRANSRAVATVNENPAKGQGFFDRLLDGGQAIVDWLKKLIKTATEKGWLDDVKKNPGQKDMKSAEKRREEAARPPDAPMAPKSEAARPVEAAPNRVEPPLLIPKFNSGNSVPLAGIKKDSGTTAELLGLPEKIGNLSLRVNEEKPYLVVWANKLELATIHCKPGEEWVFKWANTQSFAIDLNPVRAVLLRCVLKVTLMNGESHYYPLQQPERIPLEFRRVVGSTPPSFSAKLPFSENAAAGKQSSLVLGKRATAILDAQRVSLENHGGRFTGKTDRGDLEVDLSFDGAAILMKCTGTKSAVIESCTLQELELFREFGDQKVKVAEIIK